jgi:hypothetical protein
MASQKVNRAKIDKALRWANKQEELIKSGYNYDYSALQNLFDKLDLRKELNVTAAAYAVYGWMPTRLKRTEASELIKFVREVKNSTTKKDALNQLRKQPNITQAVNGSTVGTSKFLHFIAPKIFPIWDSNVALVFEIASKINDPAVYLDYCDAVHGRLDDRDMPVVWPEELRKQKISRVRRLEFCLYAHGKCLRSPK